MARDPDGSFDYDLDSRTVGGPSPGHHLVRGLAPLYLLPCSPQRSPMGEILDGHWAACNMCRINKSKMPDKRAEDAHMMTGECAELTGRHCNSGCRTAQHLDRA